VSRPCPFDALLLISFGGPNAVDEIRPFLANVLRGRRIPPARIEAVVHHYERFGGISPLTEITMRQAEGLRARLASAPLPVYVGMRNWHPFLDDTLQEMSAAGVRRAVGLILAGHHSYSSCGQYKQNVAQAQETLRASGGRDLAVTYVPGWHTAAGFIETNARHIETARGNLPKHVRDEARLVFTAHSIPVTMAQASRYEADLKESAAAIAQRLGWANWALVFQSRSGRPGDPWLEPDICDYLRAESQHGLAAVVISPIGFVADHVEVLYDLDHEAAETCATVGIAMQRAASVNDDSMFLNALAEAVLAQCERYVGGRPLPLISSTPPRIEAAPPAR
jgi:ferrochelatase